MKAGIITIGDEILLGQTIDTNSNWIANKLSDINIQVKQITSIEDKETAIIETLNDFLNRYDLVLLTGGLGPTSDDITKPALAKYFKTKLIIDDNTINNLEELSKKRNRILTERIIKQAEIPESATIIKNNKGTAPGMWFDINDKIVVSMPGVPFEMKGMMEESILTLLEKRNTQSCFTAHKHILTQGLSEPQLADMLAEWEQSLPSTISIAYLPSPSMIKLRLTAIGESKNIAENIINEVLLDLKKLISEFIIGFDSNSIEDILVKLLIENNLTIATAESCTGGSISKKITSIPGSSACFLGGIVAYANQSKHEILNVNDRNIDEYGAVSKEVVEDMAKGALSLYHADFAVSTSGIAGPGGGTDLKPVGTIWIAVASKNKVISEKFMFFNDRNVNIESTTNTALNMLFKLVQKTIR